MTYPEIKGKIVSVFNSVSKLPDYDITLMTYIILVCQKKKGYSGTFYDFILLIREMTEDQDISISRIKKVLRYDIMPYVFRHFGFDYKIPKAVIMNIEPSHVFNIDLLDIEEEKEEEVLLTLELKCFWDHAFDINILNASNNSICELKRVPEQYLNDVMSIDNDLTMSSHSNIIFKEVRVKHFTPISSKILKENI